MLKILHTGDIHLDSPFSGLDPVTAEVRRNELRAAFTSLFHYAKVEKVDLILIAGDLFDSEFVTRETVALINREASAASCPIVISPGNHDSVSGAGVWKRGVFPDNVHIFTEDSLEYFDFPELDARVWGWAFTSKFMDSCPLTGKSIRDGEGNVRYKILCAHGDLVTSGSTSCPMKMSDLVSFGADYAALGHVHNPVEYSDRVAYCGCLEGRSFDETGHKGALLVTLDGKSITTEKVRFSKRRYENDEVRVDGAASNGELREMITRHITDNHYGDDTVLRLTLKGEVDPSFTVNKLFLETDAPRVFSLKIIDKTSPMLDAESLRRDPTVRGEFYRLLEKDLLSDDEKTRSTAAAALRAGLAALAGEAVTV